MKAVRLLEQGKLELQEIPKPIIKEDEILIRVRAESICGTDVRMWKNGASNASPEQPLRLGHEFSG